MKSMLKLSLAASALVLAALSNAFSMQVTVQPILVADTNGSNLSSETSYRNYVEKIFAQADVEVLFLSTNFLNDTAYNHFNENNAWAMVNAPGKGQNANNLVINAWFVDEVINASVYGFGFLDQPFMVMDTSAIESFSALGRVDTFSHELGHVLNLPHWDDAHGSDPDVEDHLMASGGIRNIPQALGDVFPDGEGWDKLSQSEIDTIRSSRFAIPVPEPASMAVLGLGVAFLARRRRSRS